MKKIITSIIGIILVISVVSCGVDIEKTPPETQGEVEVTNQENTFEDLFPKKDEKISKRVLKYETLTKNININNPEEYLSYNWPSGHEEKITAHKGDILSYPFQLTNISEFDLDIEFIFSFYAKYLDKEGNLIKTFKIKSGETLELTAIAQVSHNDLRNIWLVLGECRFENEENEISGVAGNKNLIKRVSVEKIDAPEVNFVWEKELPSNDDSSTQIIKLISDKIYLQTRFVNCSNEGYWIPCDSWYSFTCLDFKTGNEIWVIPEDVFGEEKITDFKFIDDKLVFSTEKIDLTRDFFEEKQPQNTTQYCANIYTGEILPDTGEEIKEFIISNTVTAENRYRIRVDKDNIPGLAVIYDAKDDKDLWELQYDEIFDFQVIDEMIFVSYSLASNENTWEKEHYIQKYSLDGKLQKSIMTDNITIFLYSGNHLFFESGTIEFGDVSNVRHDPYPSLVYHDDMAFMNLDYISYIDQETLGPIWTKKIQDRDDHELDSTKRWREWYFDEDQIIVFRGNLISAINIETGEERWTMDTKKFELERLYSSTVYDGYIEIVIEDSRYVPTYMKMFFDLDDAKIIEEKTEFYQFTHRRSILDREKYSLDGYIIDNGQWFDPETFSELGSITLDSKCSNGYIFDIKDGYILYTGECPEFLEQSEDRRQRYLICKKIE